MCACAVVRVYQYGICVCECISVESVCASPQANPDPNTCLGVFGLSLYTTERDLREVFSRYGPLAGVNVVYDQRTGRSRGFSFVYFERIDDAKEVWALVAGVAWRDVA